MKTGLIILLSLFSLSLSGQAIKGKIFDSETKEPLSFASVYLEGTTIGTVSDRKGQFSLILKDRIFTKLVVSFTGYKSEIIEKPFEAMPDTIFLIPSLNNLAEIVIGKKSFFTRKQQLASFREQFLGVSKAGKSCKILNENDLYFIFNPEDNTFHTYCDVPIEVINNYLGYKIRWDLKECTFYLKNSKSLKSRNIDSVYIAGTAFFEDLANSRSLYNNKREKINQFSKNRFFRLLFENRLDSSDFRLINSELLAEEYVSFMPSDSVFQRTKTEDGSSIAKFALHLPYKSEADERKVILANIKSVITKTISNKEVRIDTENTKVENYTEPVKINFTYYNYVGIKGPDFYTVSFSELLFRTGIFCVDKYGNTDLDRALFVKGTIGMQRVGDQLPIDYLP